MSQQPPPSFPSRSPRYLWLLVPLALVVLGGLAWLRPAAAPAVSPAQTAVPAGMTPASGDTATPTTGAAVDSPAATATATAPSPSPSSADATAPLPAATLTEAPAAGTPNAAGVPAATLGAPLPSPTTAAAPFSPADTLAALEHAQVPGRDLYTLTAQIKLKTTAPLPHSSGGPPPVYQLGDSTTFAVADIASGTSYTVTASLRDITAHAYWWVAAGNDIDLVALRQSAARFESKIYPGDRATFGEPPNPGVDNDPHINVLNVSLGGAAAGYFSAADMYTRTVNPFSNERKMIYAAYPPGGAAYEGLLAHEFQHMIHWNVHPNQNIWINEGMAELAMKINGYDTGGSEAVFEADPDLQLNDWSSPPSTAIGHYGAAFLFMEYLYEHYGAGVIGAILRAPGADTDAIDQGFAALGRPERFQSVFTDWALANWLDTPTPDARYAYPHLRVQLTPRPALDPLPATYSGTVHQQAADYLPIAAPGPGGATVRFQGDSTVPLIAAHPHSGQAFWWSNRGDVAAPNLTRAFDLRAVPRATLSYWTWYDIEDGYDYAYAEVSTDNGQTWDTLPGAATTTANPNGNNLGHGYTGRSGDGDTPAWIYEQADLSAYAGKPIQVRFQYVTDDGVNYQGFAVDDLRIPEIGFQDDAEAPGAGGWVAQGFVHVAPLLPEQFVVELITYPTSGIPAITPMPLDGANQGQLPIPAGTQRAVLMVAPLAPATTQLGHYRVAVTAP